MTSGFGLFAVIVLVLANGFFVATEFAIVAIRRSRLEELSSKGNHHAKSAIEVVTHLDIYIAACQLGITMASLALGWIGEPALAGLIDPLAEKIVGSFAPAVAHTVAIALSFAVITALLIVAGELAPKGLALQRTETTVLWVAGPIRLFYRIFRWPTRILNNTGNGLLRLVGLKPTSEIETVHSLGELHVVLKGMQQAGVIGNKEIDYVIRVFSTAQLRICDIMTTRTAIVPIDKGMTIARFLEFNSRQTFSHFPVIDGSLDNVVGMLKVKAVLQALGDQQVSENDPVTRVASPALFVPEQKGVLELMDEMRREGRTIAMVTDEFGQISGLITFKQVMGEIVGQVKQEGASDPFIQLGGGIVQIDGATRVRDINMGLAFSLPESDQYDTLAGLLLARLGHIPEQGERLNINGFSLEVAQVQRRRIARVNVFRIPKK